jgi:predicted transcriptional regulator
MRPPCELVVRYVLPTFRSLVARELVEKYDLSQVAAAEKLGTTQAAISHYVYSKRGEKRMQEFESAVKPTASQVAQDIANGKISALDAMTMFCRLCVELRNKNAVCELHKDTVPLPENCDICLKK